MHKFSTTKLVDVEGDDSSIIPLFVKESGYRLILSAMDNIDRPYLWADWELAEVLIKETLYDMTTNIETYLERIIDKLGGVGGGSASLTMNCCLGADGAGTLPLPEETVTGEYEGTGGVPDYTEEDGLLSAASNDNCRRGHYAAYWIAELINTIGMPNPSTTDLVAVTALANRQIVQTSINTAVKLLPASDAAVVIDGVTGKIIRGGTAIGKVAKGGTLVGIIFYILTEVLAAAIRAELAKWQNVAVVGNIIGSSPSLSVLFERLRDANLIEGQISARRILLMLTGVGTAVTGVGDILGSLAGVWWIAINRDWDWFPDAETLAVMFPSVSCSYVPPSTIYVGRHRSGLGFDVLTANASGDHSAFDMMGTGHVWDGRGRRLQWQITDNSLESGSYSGFKCWLYDYPVPIPDTGDGKEWLVANYDTYPPSYEFDWVDYAPTEGVLPEFALRGYVIWVGDGGFTLGFRVHEVGEVA